MIGRYRLRPGRGKHRLRDDRLLRPGDEIECYAEDIGGALDKFECLREPTKEEPTCGLVVVPRGRGWYDVVDETTGKRLNDSALRVADALALAHGPSAPGAFFAGGGVDPEGE